MKGAEEIPQVKHNPEPPTHRTRATLAVSSSFFFFPLSSLFMFTSKKEFIFGLYNTTNSTDPN